ncbi:Uma2 family endonuclease [Oscillatoria salina]|uniref:Uma2 family endonuclease n=1 Tax=Oscillatoria salina TaxID=331517 RepID=UPI0013BA3633|nr:Uma2 family endonuclease [Oscillatoria salina]MBZ8181270.1 Uma2 family endonuclease [Oscillatoria salina IIICB1]NET90400.1 Uma2 family endonuclease [Kamptonema sp. SIO1D9]
MVTSPSKTLTLAEFLKLPETKPASEYINGKIIQKPMPQGKHSMLRSQLVTTINKVAENSRIALAFPELTCTFAGYSIVPDVSVFRWDRIPKDENGYVANVFQFAPDWVIEILSPDRSQTKVTGKILHCLSHGSHLGWLIDPETRSLLVYPPGNQPEIFEAESDDLPIPDFVTNFQLTLGQLFGWLKL